MSASQARREPKPAAARNRFKRIGGPRTDREATVSLPSALLFRFCLRQSNHPLALFELAALFHKLDALESLQHASLGFDGALALQAWMLTHGAQNLD